jgi:hypothetical protein
VGSLSIHILCIYSSFVLSAEALRPYLRAARWVPLAINPYANLTAVFFTGLEEDPEDEDVAESSEMYVYAHKYMFKGTEIAYSDKQEEHFVFAEIIKLVPTFKQVVAACCDHRRALINLIRMVSLVFIISYYY